MGCFTRKENKTPSFSCSLELSCYEYPKVVIKDSVPPPSIEVGHVLTKRGGRELYFCTGISLKLRSCHHYDGAIDRRNTSWIFLSLINGQLTC